MASKREEEFILSLPEDLKRRLEEYIEKHYRAYISMRGQKTEILTEALREWLDKHGG